MRISSKLQLTILVAVAVSGTLALTACGPASSTSSPAPSKSSASSSNKRAAAKDTGKITSLTGQNLKLKSAKSETDVSFSSKTVIADASAGTAADIAVGDCVEAHASNGAAASASGAEPSGGAATGSAVPMAIDAASIRISQPTNGSCDLKGAPRTGGTNKSAKSKPGAAGVVRGSVTAINGGVLQVQGMTGGVSVSTTVTTSGTTKYIKIVSADSSTLKVGQCAKATGKSNNGSLSAKTITIVQTKNRKCK